MSELGLALSAFALLGVLATAVPWLALRLHRRRTGPRVLPILSPGVSILKPLCGVDDELAANLESFAQLDPIPGGFEVLLGLRDASDAACALARAQVRRYPAIFRLCFQEGEPGLNPKVNQLVTLERRARFPLLVVSDSNVRVPRSYLREVVAEMSQPNVGCLTHPIAGLGEQSWGARMDNLHLSASVATGMVGAQRVLRRHLVVGKSMALWRSDLTRLGGFASVKDFLAEDHVLGNRIERELGKRIVISTEPIFNVAVHRSAGSFFRRYLRWSIIHRTAVPPLAYLGGALLNPIPFALLGALTAPGRTTLAVLTLVVLTKALLDLTALRLLRGDGGGVRALIAVPLKDLLVFLAWTYGLFARTLVWRGNRLRVLHGSRLVAPAPEPVSMESEAMP